MTLTFTLERKERFGSLKVFIFAGTDDNSGLTFDLSSYLNHIYWADVYNMTTGAKVTATIADGTETITISGTTGLVKVIVIGS